MAQVIFQLVLLPVHITLAWLFLAVRGGAPKAGWRGFDLTIIVLAFVAWIAAAVWGYQTEHPGFGPIWPVVYATAASYTVFNIVLWSGWLLRRYRARRSV